MRQFQRIVILTGAGVSAESGLRTFRDHGGLWEEHSIYDVATPEAFARNPALVQKFYNERRAKLQTAEPNAAHFALARLEAAFSGTVTLVTQNVDDLHVRAGSRNVIPMHGELKKVRCRACGQVHLWEGHCDEGSVCPACGAIGRLRPHIVWFGEMPLEMDRIGAALEVCDLFISIGTSGSVYPAAGFVAEVRGIGHAHTVELNLEPSEGSRMFAETHYGPATQVVPEFVERLLSD